MKSEYMKTANQKSKFQNCSEAFTEVHNASKGVYVPGLHKNILTNEQKCLLHGVQENGRSEKNTTVESVEELELDFGV